MASNDDQIQSSYQNEDEFCTIEASVVTGFEESARGEAKEKFGTEVKAARGKITWGIPLNRVKDVLSMGSVDNCRVVVHSVPHFKFTDQHDSLARLQKMVKDVDWESGLRAWRCVYDFPYPIVTRPEKDIPDNDLVDVVVITHQPPPKDKPGKKNKKKGGRERKRDKKRADRRHENSVNCDSGVGTLADGKSMLNSEDGVTEGVPVTDFDVSFDQYSKSPVDEKGDAVNQEKEETTASPEEAVSRSPEAEGDKHQISLESQLSDSADGVGLNLQQSPGQDKVTAALVDGEEQTLQKLEGLVITETSSDIQQVDNEGADENKSVDSELVVNQDVETCEEMTAQLTESVGDSNASPPHKSSTEGNLSPASRKITESEFASIVIRRLTSPSQAACKEETSGADSPKTCVTPPPTPIRSIDNPFSNLQGRLQSELLPFIDNVNKFPDKGNSLPEAELVDSCSSVVDPSASASECRMPAEDVFGTNNVSSSIPSLSTLAASANAETNFIPSKDRSSEHSVLHGQQMDVDESHLEGKSGSVDEVTPVKKERDPTKPTFRVTCNRTGDSHSFDSSSAAASFGSAIITYLGWQVDLKNFDIEVILNIDNEEVTVALGLTKMSLHYRNLVAFGPTTLRATIGYNMLRLCRIKNGDFVCDPMCGTSAIPIEAALNWVNCYHLGGDVHEKAIEKTVLNIAAVQEKMKMNNRGSLKLDAVRWDVQYLPLRDKTVDVFVSDLPFGHRMGYKSGNLTLYSHLLTEMARTARSGARACLLTEDKGSLIKAVQTLSRYWQRRLVLNINIGGLSGFVFLLTRTTTLAQSWVNWRNDGNQAADGDTTGEATQTVSSESVSPPFQEAES